MSFPKRSLSLVAGLALGLSLTACGGSDSSSAGADPTATTTVESASPSASPSEDPQLTGLEAQAIGLAVADYSVNHDFTAPADQAEFEAKVDYSKDLKPGSKVGYQKVGAKNYQVCVTHFDGSEPTTWGLFDGASGKATSGSGKPTEAFCPA